MMLLTWNEAFLVAGKSFGSVVAASGFGLCLSTLKMSFEKAMTIRVCRHSLPVKTSTGSKIRVVTLWSFRRYIFSGEMNYISLISPECTSEGLHFIWPWSHFIFDGSLFSLVWYPYQISRKSWRQIPSPVMSIKIYFLLPSLLLLPFNHKHFMWNMRFLSFSGTTDIRSKLPIHQEPCRWIPTGKWSWPLH